MYFAFNPDHYRDVSLLWRTTKACATARPESCDLRSIPITIGMYLCSDEQLELLVVVASFCCDLLSKNCIFVLTNNYIIFDSGNIVVVICFQKIVSLFWRTTNIISNHRPNPLWFAFKKLYLCSDEQPGAVTLTVIGSCDLLSKNCIFVLTNNLLNHL